MVNGVRQYVLTDAGSFYRGTLDLAVGTDPTRYERTLNLLLNNRPRLRVRRFLPLAARRRALTQAEFDQLATLAGRRFVRDLFDIAQFQI